MRITSLASHFRLYNRAKSDPGLICQAAAAKSMIYFCFLGIQRFPAGTATNGLSLI
ncbi:MAG: hypothetical protein RIR52_1920 [Acidobacteriota bacterium]